MIQILAAICIIRFISTICPDSYRDWHSISIYNKTGGIHENLRIAFIACFAQKNYFEQEAVQLKVAELEGSFAV